MIDSRPLFTSDGKISKFVIFSAILLLWSWEIFGHSLRSQDRLLLHLYHTTLSTLKLTMPFSMHDHSRDWPTAYAFTCARIYTHTCSYALSYMHNCHAHWCTHMHLCTHIRALAPHTLVHYAHALVHTHSFTHTQVCIHISAYAQVNTHAFTYTQPHTHARAWRIYMHIHTFMHTCPHAYTYTCMLMNTPGMKCFHYCMHYACETFKE